MNNNRMNALTLGAGACILAAACVVIAQNAPGGGRGPAPEPKPTIMAPDADKGDDAPSGFGGMGRRNVSGKVAEEGRAGGGWGAWPRRRISARGIWRGER